MTTKYYVVDDFEITQGDDWVQEYQLQNNDGLSLDITGYSFTFAIKKYDRSTDVLIGPINGVIVNASTGNFKLALTSAQTSALELGNYVYTVEIANVSGNKTTCLKGAFTISWSAA